MQSYLIGIVIIRLHTLIFRVNRALEYASTAIRSFMKNKMLVLEVKGIGHFRNAVIFAKVEKGVSELQQIAGNIKLRTTIIIDYGVQSGIIHTIHVG